MDANIIIDRLWISDGETAANMDFIKLNNITAILNITNDYPNKFISNKIDYGNIYVDDSLTEKDYIIMHKCLPYAVEFIHKNRDIDNKNVLVHCAAGQQRSCAGVLAYLLKHHPYLAPSIKKGANFIHSKRNKAWHNNNAINFDQALIKYYNTHIKKSVTKETPKKITHTKDSKSTSPKPKKDKTKYNKNKQSKSTEIKIEKNK